MELNLIIINKNLNKIIRRENQVKILNFHLLKKNHQILKDQILLPQPLVSYRNKNLRIVLEVNPKNNQMVKVLKAQVNKLLLVMVKKLELHN
jgi:hypothetical protein